MVRKVKPPKPPRPSKARIIDLVDHSAFVADWFDDDDDDDGDEDDILDDDEEAPGESPFTIVGPAGRRPGGISSGNDLDYSIIDEDIPAICGAANARRGLALFLNGAISGGEFDGRGIGAKVTDGADVLEVSFEFEEELFHCSLPADRRGLKRACAHVAALLYAWQRQPMSFAFANLGAALQLYAQRPQVFTGGGMLPAYLQSVLAAWDAATPEQRREISQMSASSSPADVAKLQAKLAELDAKQLNGELADLLGRLSLEQLRAIAKRRRWTLRATAKAKMIAELIEQLRASPLPESFSPEEEQLVRIENTLWGLNGLVRHHILLLEWSTHAGGNRKRLELALEGLQNAGVLFACTSEGIGLHYHWSPFLRSDMLPLLQPNVALLAPGGGPPARGAGVQGAGRPLPTGGGPPARGAGVEAAAGPALLNLIDAVISFAEREPLRLYLVSFDSRLAEFPAIGQWAYDPAELQPVLKSPARSVMLPGILTVPWLPYFSTETEEALTALAGGVKAYGQWTALLLIHAGIIVRSEAAEGVVDAARAAGWRALSPDQQLQRLWDAWCAGVSPPIELRMALQDKQFILRRSTFDAEFTPQVLAFEAGLARSFVVRVLAMLSPQTWYDWPALAACIKRLRSAFFYSYTTPQQWWIEHAPTARRYDPNIPQQWDAVWLPVLQSLLTGPLAWFGAVEISEQGATSPQHRGAAGREPAANEQGATSPQHRGAAGREPAANEQGATSPQHRGAAGREPAAAGQDASSAKHNAPAGFRVTPLGAWLFTGGRQGRVPEFAAVTAAADGPSFEWLDESTFRVRATPDAMRALGALRPYTEPSRALLTFRLSMPAIGQALAAGGTLASIAQAFEAAGLPLAAGVQERITALGERMGRLNLYERVTVLELGDDMTLRELLATTSLRAHIIHEFSPRLVVVRDEAVDALVAELVKRGHTPLLA